MLIAIVWPAMISASKIICRQKPIATPIRISCSTVKPVASDRSNGCVTGISGAMTTVAADGQRDAHAHRHEPRAEHGRDHDDAGDAEERPHAQR